MTIPYQLSMADYVAGKASVTNGLNVVNFTGAALVTTDPASGDTSFAAQAGDAFIVGKEVYEIDSIVSATQLTLVQDYAGPTNAAVDYKIRHRSIPANPPMRAAINQILSLGSDDAPDQARTIDDSTARLKLYLSGFLAKIGVAAYSGGVLQSLKEALSIDPATGVVSFPNGLAHNNPGFRNRLINGNFDVWQRGANFSVDHAAKPFLADRWYCYNALGVTSTVSKVAAPAGFLGAQAINIAATGVAATKQVDLRQAFEARAVADLDGKACVLSLDVSASTSAGSLTAQAIMLGNTAVDNGSYSVTMASVTFAIPVGVGRVAIPFTAAQMTGLKNGAALYIRFTQTGATGNPNITLGAVQFEADPSGAGKANPFEFRPLHVENAMCKRYYWRSQLSDLIGPTGTTTIRSIGRHPVTMRATPTVVLLKTTFESGGPSYNLQSGASWVSATGCAINSYGMSTETYSIVIGGFSGLTNGALATGNGPSEVFEFSAELGI